MKSKFLLFVLVCILFPSSFVHAQGDVAILSPTDGEGVKGRIIITGYIKATNAVRYDLDFAYTGQESAGWQPISTAEKPSEDGSLGVWDTTAISDGNYTLRLRVYLSDGQTSDHLVSGVRVRNYSIMETSTPSALTGMTTSQPTPTLVSLLPVGAPSKALPPNPAAITSQKLQINLVASILMGLIISFSLAFLFRNKKSNL